MVSLFNKIGKRPFTHRFESNLGFHPLSQPSITYFLSFLSLTFSIHFCFFSPFLVFNFLFSIKRFFVLHSVFHGFVSCHILAVFIVEEQIGCWFSSLTPMVLQFLYCFNLGMCLQLCIWMPLSQFVLSFFFLFWCLIL